MPKNGVKGGAANCLKFPESDYAVGLRRRLHEVSGPRYSKSVRGWSNQNRQRPHGGVLGTQELSGGYCHHRLGHEADERVRVPGDAIHSPNPYVPTIMLTAFTEIEWVKETRNRGVTEFLAMPFTPQKL